MTQPRDGSWSGRRRLVPARPSHPVALYRRAMARVLVVEDDPIVAEVVSSYLTRAGHDVRSAATVAAAVRAAAQQPPDVVVLDVMLPDGTGLELCTRLRRDTGCAVIVLSALGSSDDRIAGLENGADDYVSKPFSPRELVLRVAAVLRPRAAGSALPLRIGSLEVDSRSRRATAGGVELALTVREFDLLAHLAAHPGQVFTRTELLREVWGWTFGDSSTVTVHVRRLREKVETDPMRPELIVTVWGVGYRLQVPRDAPATPSTAPRR